MAFGCHNDQNASFKRACYMRQVCLPVGCYDAGEDRDLIIGECKGIRESANQVHHSRFCFFELAKFTRIPGSGHHSGEISGRAAGNQYVFRALRICIHDDQCGHLLTLILQLDCHLLCDISAQGPPEQVIGAGFLNAAYFLDVVRCHVPNGWVRRLRSVKAPCLETVERVVGRHVPGQR